MICNKVIIIKNGKQILESDIKSITTKKDLFFIKTTGIGEAAKVLNEKKYVKVNKIEKNGIIVQANESSIALVIKELVNKNIPIYEVSVSNKSLEDIFIEVTGGN
ncbi:DUF4162 domain-containing protein [Paraclostridium benzoelyticum]